jgi:hypothetical protein
LTQRGEENRIESQSGTRHHQTSGQAGNKLRMDKRKYPRFSVEENVIVALQNGLNRIGKVKDISLGGLSFEHIYDGNLNWMDSKKNILIWVNDCSLPKIPCKIVYNTSLKIRPEYSLLTIQFITNRCGVQFEPLTDYQADQLDFFLKTYTKGKA